MIHTPVIDNDIPFADFTPKFEDLEERVNVAFASIASLGNDVEVSDTDEIVARQIFTGSKPASAVNLSSPGTVVHLKAILSEYDKQVVESAAQLRVYVTNKLIEESTNPDPRIRIKALEMIGKISDVGLFTEKTEITLRHRPTAELEQMLRERLEKVIGAHDHTVAMPEDLQTPRHLNIDALSAEPADYVEEHTA